MEEHSFKSVLTSLFSIKINEFHIYYSVAQDIEEKIICITVILCLQCYTKEFRCITGYGVVLIVGNEFSVIVNYETKLHFSKS